MLDIVYKNIFDLYPKGVTGFEWPKCAKVEHKDENQVSSKVEFDLLVLYSNILLSDHGTSEQDIKVQLTQTKIGSFSHLIF